MQIGEKAEVLTCCETKLRLQNVLTKFGLSDARRQESNTLTIVRKSLLPNIRWARGAKLTNCKTLFGSICSRFVPERGDEWTL